ncbi:thyrotropin releasing hormone [Suncus etruscus]|uniref:thyrotropin releasing hormone n=1 Tax=Suncus etruscus TaxID=109475 RepID=UPI002110B5DC|nr:thyrotropin releasing hormone [Suncus etruscus]
MLGLWMMITLALTLVSIPGHAQPDVAQQDSPSAESPSLDDLLRQAQRFLLLREDLLQLHAANQHDGESELQVFSPSWVSKRQHPGKRNEEEEEQEQEVAEAEEEERGTVGPYKRQHPGRRDDVALGSLGAPQQKRQHPGRRSSWLPSIFTKRQHPGRRLVDLQAQEGDEKEEGAWEEEEEEEEEGELMPEKRQHPGKRALGNWCGPWRTCGQASLLLGILEDLSRDQGAENKRQHPGRRAAWMGESLEV